MIEFNNVSLIYPTSSKTILEDLSFTIEEGELVLVIGPTGSGKSSLLRLINGLVPHHTGGILAGEITVAGMTTQLVKPGGFAHVVGIVGQNPANSFVTDTVEEELAFGMESLNFAPDMMRKRIEEVLDLLSLAPLRDRTLASLSGGEAQRVAIGSALVMSPKVLVLDEPTSALDPIAAEEVLSILNRLVHDLSLTVIIAEHKLERVIQFADRILEIQGDGHSRLGSAQEILKTSAIAPPIVHLARALGLEDVGVSVREVRRMTSELRESSIATPAVHTSFEEPRVRIENVTVRYGDHVAINDLTASFHAGEITAVMGRNGAGKSSLLKTIVGVSAPTRGKASVMGQTSHLLQGAARRKSIGYIPQEPSDLLYNQSVIEECSQADRDNLVEPGTTLKTLRSISRGINENAHPRDLSEGQRLALTLAIVLSTRPEVLVMDEPTRGLDYEAKAALINSLKGIATTLNTTVIVATHDVELVAELADRIFFIADGEKVADGPALDVLLSSPAFAPQVAKIMSPQPWLTVSDVIKALADR